MTYFFAYDIADYYRRNSFAKKLGQFGIRVQKSFFQCNISHELAESIKRELAAIMDKKEDSLICYPVCADCFIQERTLGGGRLMYDQEFEVL
jgi:CRISPR-associated protein Cas2